MGRGGSFIIPRLVDSSSISRSPFLYSEDTGNRKGHRTLRRFLTHVELPEGWQENVPMQMSQSRNVTFVPPTGLHTARPPPPSADTRA